MLFRDSVKMQGIAVQDSRELEGLIRAALGEAVSMLNATSDSPADAKVTMSAPQFRKLALLLRKTAQLAERELDRFDRPVGGIQFWVPLPRFEAERAKLAQLREKYDQAVLYQGHPGGYRNQ